MKRYVIYLYFSVSIALQGCVPMTGTYYAPTGESGNTVLSECRGYAGYPSVFKFKHDQFMGEIHNLIFEETNELAITIILKIKKDSVLTINSKNLKIQTNGEIKDYSFENMKAFTVGRAGSYDISEKTTFFGTDHNGYEFDSTIKIDSDQFVLVLPKFYINNKAIDLGAITYTKKKGWAIFPINC